jgi:cephalosporin hydroxylase
MLGTRIKNRIKSGLLRVARYLGEPSIEEQFFTRLVRKTSNFGSLTWLGKPIWQNLLDLWTIQETIYQLRPGLLIETGTNRGGSSYFFAQLFDLMGYGQVITIDVQKLHDLSHPRIAYLLGNSISDEVLRQVQAASRGIAGPVMVVLDSDHSEPHVTAELEAYSRFVTPGSYLLVQDAVIDTLPVFADARPGPLRAIRSFLVRHSEFELDRERCERFLISHHPEGWLRRKE